MVTLTWAMERAAPLNGQIRVLVLTIARFENGPDRFDRFIEPARDLPVGRFEPARARHGAIELSREPRTIRIEGIDLGCKRRMAALMIDSPLDGRFECNERVLQAPGCRLDFARIRHSDPAPWPALHRTIENRFDGRMLQMEAYVLRGARVNVAVGVFNVRERSRAPSRTFDVDGSGCAAALL
jgi:hypothetical protein